MALFLLLDLYICIYSIFICALKRTKTLKRFDYRGTSWSNQQYFVIICNCCIFMNTSILVYVLVSISRHTTQSMDLEALTFSINLLQQLVYIYDITWVIILSDHLLISYVLKIASNVYPLLISIWYKVYLHLNKFPAF